MTKAAKEVPETRVALIGIIVSDPDSVCLVNEILHDYREYVIGRIGIPYRERKISIISIAIDAPQDSISTLSGKIGLLPGVSIKTAYAKVGNDSGNIGADADE